MTTPKKRTRPPVRDASRIQDADPNRHRPLAPVPVRLPDVAGPPRLILRAGREKSLQRRHPWIFSGAVERVEGRLNSGDTVQVRSSLGGFLGHAAYSPSSQILARVWDFHEGAEIGAEFFAESIRRAVCRRDRVYGADAGLGVRLVHGEADGLPGVVLDRFGDIGVLQLTSAGASRWRDQIAAAVMAVTDVRSLFERSDADVMQLEGLAPRVGPLIGQEPEAPVVIEENGLRFSVDLRAGHKTGFYLDQRDNRALVRDLSRDREVLDAFCYTGGFALSALAGGASRVTAIDSSADALAAAREHVALNGLSAERTEFIEADVFAHLRRFRDQARKFDLIILDPPKLAPSAAALERAARAYKDVNLWAMKLLRPGGLLFSFSCSGAMQRDLFQKVLAGAAVDAGVEARILHHLSAAADHPVTLAFPEGEYLKGLLCEIG